MNYHQHVMASTTEVEIAAIFRNSQHTVILQHALKFMGYPQPATPIQVDNGCFLGILTDSVKQRQSKATNMRFNWVKYRTK